MIEVILRGKFLQVQGTIAAILTACILEWPALINSLETVHAQQQHCRKTLGSLVYCQHSKQIQSYYGNRPLLNTGGDAQGNPLINPSFCCVSVLSSEVLFCFKFEPGFDGIQKLICANKSKQPHVRVQY